jgi:hypothetical protein
MQEVTGSSPVSPTNHPLHAPSDRITAPCCPAPTRADDRLYMSRKEQAPVGAFDLVHRDHAVANEVPIVGRDVVGQRRDDLLAQRVTHPDWSGSSTGLGLGRNGDGGASLPPELASAWQQLLDSLRALTAAGLVHADLSAYNLLWWEGRLVVIDLPRAVEFITNSDAYVLLHRDVANVSDWFTRHGLPLDVETVYAELVALAWRGRAVVTRTA